MIKKMNKRFWEIDFFRGIAIIMMIIFHFFYDLKFFGFYKINLDSGFWWIFARLIATIFIFLVGISLTLSYSRAKKNKTNNKLFTKYLIRGLKIFSWGLFISLITWVFLRKGFIIFGILHFIGLSIILAYPFLKFRFLNLLLGIIFILLGFYIQTITFNSYWLVWLGIIPNYLYTVDYFPILPWFGVILFGLFFGNLLYPNGIRRLKIPELSEFSFVRFFCFLGRHSLLLYLIHQPILIILLYFFIF
jgi:uncharacterized membrane protein